MGLVEVVMTAGNIAHDLNFFLRLAFAMQEDDDFIKLLNGIRTGENPAALEYIAKKCSRDLSVADGILPTVLYSK